MDADQNNATLHWWSRFRTLAAIGLVVMLLAACGPLGEDDPEPTSTPASIAQPTDPAPEGESPEPDDPTTEASDEAATPESAATEPAELPDATPETIINILSGMLDQEATPEDAESGATPEAPVASPETTSADESPEPVATGAPAEEPAGQDATAPTAAVFTGSDGTSGATPDAPADTTTGEEPAATPGATPPLAVLEETSSGAAQDLLTAEPLDVTDCDPEDIPLLADGGLAFTTVTNVNLRTGPGTDCDRIGDGPLGANLQVTVLSAPVERDDLDDPIWVQVQINDTVGWVVLEALEPES